MFVQSHLLPPNFKPLLAGLVFFSLLAGVASQAAEKPLAPGPVLPLQKVVTTSTRGLFQTIDLRGNPSYQRDVISLLRQGGWGPYSVSSRGNLDLELREKSAFVADVTSGEVVFVVTDPKGIISAGLHPEGTRLVTVNGVNQAQVWDISLKKRLFSLPHKPDVALFSPKGTYVITLEKGDSCGTVRVHQAHTGTEVASFQAPSCLKSIDISPDEQHIITAINDDTVRVWNTLTGKELFSLKNAEVSTKSTIFSPNGKLLLTRDDNTVHVWSEAGSSLVRIINPGGKVVHANFSPDNERIVTAHEDHTTRIWSVSGQPLQVLKGHTQDVTRVAFTDDGQRIVTAGNDQTVRIWNASQGTLLYTLYKKPTLTHAVFTTDGTKVAVLDESHTLTVQDTKTGRLLPLPKDLGKVASVRFTEDGTHLYILARNGFYYDWTFATEQGERPWNYTYLQNQLGANQILRNADFGFVGGVIRFVTVTDDNKAQLWSSNNPNSLVTLEDQVFSARFNANHTQFATITQANTGHTVRLWDAWSGKPLAVLDGHRDAVQSVVFSPKGNYIATASSDETTCLWNAKTGNLQAVLQGHKEAVRGAVFSADDSQLLTWGDDRTARLWDVATGTQRGIFAGEYPFVQATFVENHIRLLDEKQQMWEGALPANWSALPGLQGMYYGMTRAEMLEQMFSKRTTPSISCSVSNIVWGLLKCQNFPLDNNLPVTGDFVFTEGRLSMILLWLTKPEGVSLTDPALKIALQAQWKWLQRVGTEVLIDQEPVRNVEDILRKLPRLKVDDSLTLDLQRKGSGVLGGILSKKGPGGQSLYQVQIVPDYEVGFPPDYSSSFHLTPKSDSRWQLTTP